MRGRSPLGAAILAVGAGLFFLTDWTPHLLLHTHVPPGSSGGLKRFVQVGPGFYNAHVPFRIFHVLDIGTQMSLCELPNGKFVVLDTVELDDALKADIDMLTDSGRLIEAVVATHPFHTLAFPAFHRQYPAPQYFGTPRHLRRLPNIPWAGDVSEEAVHRRWEPHLAMLIPAGAEFDHPLPESSNHFSNLFVLHRASRTVHTDDTVLYLRHPGLLLRLFGLHDGTMMFHPSIRGPGLLPTPEAPRQFERWAEALLRDWDFDTLCSAHNACREGGAKAMLQRTLDDARPLLRRLEQARG
eukprot:EG_transcript_21192